MKAEKDDAKGNEQWEGVGEAEDEVSKRNCLRIVLIMKAAKLVWGGAMKKSDQSGVGIGRVGVARRYYQAVAWWRWLKKDPWWS